MRPEDWSDDPDQWPDIESLDMDFEGSVEKLLKMPPGSIDPMEMET